MTEEDVRAALRDCYDPVLPSNIVDLGVVERIELMPDGSAPGRGIPGVPPKYRVAIALVPTTQDEVSTAHLRAQVANRLAGIEAISYTAIMLLDHPAWTPVRITAAGRRLLGLDGNPALVQIAVGHVQG